MNATTLTARRPARPGAPLMAYHVLHAALAPTRASAEQPPARFAQAVERVVCGLVGHAQYAGAASAAASRGLPFAQTWRNLERAAAHDVNPLAALFPPGLAPRNFEVRWNALNEAAQFGVATEVAAPGTADAAIRRTPRTRERDHVLRAALMENCVEWLATRTADEAHAGECPLVSLSLRLGQERSAAHEVTQYLYAGSAEDLGQCAAALAVSPRTLQRQLARDGLTFALLRQAVRITIAGQRMRTRAESITDTAHAAGFYDAAHLIHAWQRACGVAPSVYRAIATEARS